MMDALELFSVKFPQTWVIHKDQYALQPWVKAVINDVAVELYDRSDKMNEYMVTEDEWIIFKKIMALASGDYIDPDDDTTFNKVDKIITSHEFLGLKKNWDYDE